MGGVASHNRVGKRADLAFRMEHVEPSQASPERARLTFRRRNRLTRALEYRAVYRARMCVPAGPLRVHVAPNGLDQPRLGLAVGKAVGGAVRRNRVKRLLREAFRLERPQIPRAAEGSYDVVVNVRAHDHMPLSRYRTLLIDAVRAAHERWARRERRREPDAP